MVTVWLYSLHCPSKRYCAAQSLQRRDQQRAQNTRSRPACPRSPSMQSWRNARPSCGDAVHSFDLSRWRRRCHARTQSRGPQRRAERISHDSAEMPLATLAAPCCSHHLFIGAARVTRAGSSKAALEPLGATIGPASMSARTVAMDRAASAGISPEQSPLLWPSILPRVAITQPMNLSVARSVTGGRRVYGGSAWKLKVTGYPKVYQKFQNPTDPSLNWSGRGRQPRWVTKLLKAGKRLDDLRITSSAALVPADT
jgi:hypothetical protein